MKVCTDDQAGLSKTGVGRIDDLRLKKIECLNAFMTDECDLGQ